MQVDPIKSTLKAPGTKLLKLKIYAPLSNCALKFNLRRYNQALADNGVAENDKKEYIAASEAWDVKADALSAGAYTRPLLAQSEPFLIQKHTLNTPQFPPST